MHFRRLLQDKFSCSIFLFIHIYLCFFHYSFFLPCIPLEFPISVPQLHLHLNYTSSVALNASNVVQHVTAEHKHCHYKRL